MKPLLANLKKYHFWILCVVVIAFGLGTWYVSTSSLKAETEKNAAEIKSKDTQVTSVANAQLHPNEQFLTGMDKLIEDYSLSLAEGWQHRYDQQKSLLVWPEFLGEDFHQEVNGLRPIEAHAGFDEKGYTATRDIDGVYLERYRNFITRELPVLALKIGANWTAKVGEARGTSGGGAGAGKMAAGGPKMGYGGSQRGLGSDVEEEDNSIVRWNEANQQDILDNHFAFASEEKTPHTLDVLYAQEDLWVLEAILDVIKRTNGDADANYNAAIKEIESIQMGRTVRGRMGQITMLGNATGSGVPGGMMGGMMGPMSPGGGSSAGPSPGGSSAGPPPGGSSMGPMGPMGSMAPPGSGTGGTGGASGLIDPALGRYVDVDYKPLDPKDLRAARTSDDPKLAIYSVAKRMPVQMRLRIDQRKLNDLLAECGNSSLPIEVRQVRINCEPGSDGGSMSGSMGGGSSYGGSSASSASSAGPSSAGPSPGGSSKSMGPSMSSPGGGGRRSSMGSMGGTNSMGEETKDANEIVVDVFGIVHIYNPVNEKQLNLNQDVATPTAVTSTAAPPPS